MEDEFINESDSSEIEEVEINEANDPFDIDINLFKVPNIIEIFQNHNIINKVILCPKCQNKMKLVGDKSYIDKFIFRCRSINPNHDIKLNLRNGTIFENIQIPINLIYYLVFSCFIDNISINKTEAKMKAFCKKSDISNISKSNIIKLFRLVRNKIKINMHNSWRSKLLGLEPTVRGYPEIEIDESHIIGNSESNIWIFGLIDRVDKDVRVFCVRDRTSATLLEIIKNNVNTIINENNLDIRTRIFSDSFSSYQPQTFLELGFVLKRINHSISFGSGICNTNTIESLWSTIKRILHNFAGINFKLIENLEKKGITIYDYIDDWFVMDYL